MDNLTRVRAYVTGKRAKRIRDLESDVDKLYTEVKIKVPKKQKAKDPDDVLIHNKEELELYLKSFGIEPVDNTDKIL